MKPGQPFADLHALATHLRQELENKKTILLYAYNGTGKTRLSMAFKDIGKQGGDEQRDTLYFNAFTEDLFHWNNDLEGDADRRLLLNKDSRFFQGLFELEMDNRIRPLLQRYADFEFRISDRSGAGEQTGFTLLGRESTEIFLHLLGKDLVLTPRPDQMAALSPVGLAMHQPSARFLADAHNGHAPQNWVPDPELENGVLPYNGSLWGLTRTAPQALTRVLFRKQRQFGYFVPPTPYGIIAMVPAGADLRQVAGVEEWWHTDGVWLWREGQPKLTGMAAAKALEASAASAARKLPFRASGDDVFFQAIRLGAGVYRLYAIDPGWLDPKARRIRITGRGTSWRLRDLLSGEAVPVRNGAAELEVPAGSLRILEAREPG